MGAEARCRVCYKGRWVEGDAMLETGFLLFRGGDLRLKLMFKDFSSVAAAKGALHLTTADGPVVLSLGSKASKWSDKILNPPSRLHKLGVKQGCEAAIIGEFDRTFQGELETAGAKIVSGRARADLVFYWCPARAQLGRVKSLVAGLKPAGGLWVVYPKGARGIREIEVLSAGREAGLKDSKVCSFSETHTGLKFVIPLTARGI